MKLIYRGVAYTLTPTPIPSDRNHRAATRGALLETMKVPDSVLCLKYRGVPYLRVPGNHLR